MKYFLKYINFLWHSKNAHGVHSPFVYKLVTKCLLDFEDKPEYKAIDKEIAQHRYSLSQTQATLLFRLINYLQPDEVFYKGNDNTDLFSFIITQITNLKLQTANNKLQIINLKLQTPESNPETHNSQPETRNPQLKTFYFIDIKDKAAALTYFGQLLTTKNNNTTVVFNNIYASQQMQEAWHAIKNHPEVTVSADTFYFGLIFFRNEQAVEHFKIRIINSGLLNTILGVRKLWGLLD